MIFTDSSSSIFFWNLTASMNLEILHVSRFPSDLVHRHIIFLLLLENNDHYQSWQYIVMQAMLMSKQVNRGPEILHGPPPGKYR